MLEMKIISIIGGGGGGGGDRYFPSLKSMYLFQFGIVMNSKMIWPRYEEKPETHYHPYLLSFLILIEVKLLDNGI